VLFVVRSRGTPEVLMQLRSGLAHEGDTWSCPGGALDAGEDVLDGALREAAEEVGVPPTPWELLGEHVFAPANDWSYTTSVLAVPHRFGAKANFETEDLRWSRPDEVAELRLHPGFAAAWPHLRTIVDRADPT
jgi:8-oxo-dGTP diphosphatase